MPDTESLEAIPTQPKSNKLPKYIPIEQIITLRKKNLSTRQIGALLGCTGSNISQRLDKIDQNLVNTEHYKNNRAVMFQYQQQRIIQSITDADLQKANLRDKVISASILYDKERLETGQSTQNIAYIDMIKAKSSAVTEMQAIEAELIEAGIELDDTP